MPPSFPPDMNRRPSEYLLLLVSALLLVGCQSQSSDVRTRPQDLMENPEQHVGETVVISGEVDRIFTPRSFTVGGSDFARDLLIVSDDSIAPVAGRTEEVPAAENDIVQVTGVVKRFDAETFEEQYGIRLPQEAASAFDGQPVVVAQQAAQPMHGVVVSPRVPGGMPQGPVNELAMATDPSEQGGLQGRVGAFPSAPILEGIRPRMFWIGTDADQRLLAVASPATIPDTTQAPESGEEWRVYGVFRRLPEPGILRTDWDLSEGLIKELENHEVYLNVVEVERVDGSGARTE